MNLSLNTIDELKEKGYRITELRLAIIEILTLAHGPWTITEITENLRKKWGLTPNKTSLYRELDFLINQNIAQTVDLGEGRKRYERVDCDNHHHHLVCLSCKKIEEVKFNKDLDQHEEKIFKDKKFKVTSHMLEFFGMCGTCQEKK